MKNDEMAKKETSDLVTAMMLLEIGIENAEEIYETQANEFLGGRSDGEAIDAAYGAIEHMSAAHSFIQKHLYGRHGDGYAEDLVAKIWPNDAIANASRVGTNNDE